MLLICLCSLGLRLLQTGRVLVPMTFTLTLVWTVRHRNMSRTVLCIGPPLWNEKSMPEMLLEMRYYGSAVWTACAVLTKLIVQPLRLLTLAVTVKTPGLKTTLLGGKLRWLMSSWQVWA